MSTAEGPHPDSPFDCTRETACAAHRLRADGHKPRRCDATATPGRAGDRRRWRWSWEQWQPDCSAASRVIRLRGLRREARSADGRFLRLLSSAPSDSGGCAATSANPSVFYLAFASSRSDALLPPPPLRVSSCRDAPIRLPTSDRAGCFCAPRRAHGRDDLASAERHTTCRSGCSRSAARASIRLPPNRRRRAVPLLPEVTRRHGSPRR